MPRPTEDMIETYVSLTGASRSLALLKLEEHGGDLNEAVNEHFREGDVHSTSPSSTAPPQHNFPQASNQDQVAPQQGLLPLLSVARSFKPSLLLDRNYTRDLYSRIGSALTGRAPSPSHQGEVTGFPVGFSPGNEHPHLAGQRPTIPYVARTEINASRYRNDVEEEMIQAAIEASKREAELGSPNVLPGNGLPDEKITEEHSDIDRAVLLSLKTAEQEKAMREMQLNDRNLDPGVYSTWKRGSSSHQNGAEVVEQQLVGEESNCNGGNHLQQEKLETYYDELGSLSPKELDEAIMLESALFGGSSYIPDTQPVHGFSSSSLSARQLLREQQDDDYLASLVADKEKEMNAIHEAATSQLKADANKRIEPMELERRLSAKSASLPSEPAPNDENAVTLLVRMPDGSRLSHRFRKSDKLQLLFDFIDVSRVVEPGTYKVVRSYPRHVFSANNSLSTLRELGLTNKQEALFLELI
ncbi:plant UBX domain-containing protein 8 isoform X2 [Argentina anserina]|uniref:plant UBX domain-containing protein 8 isoform X2 n=1 Tax=Argentina anserina TaxID=57926 RepID=UPI0021762D78|nr:plant UBX domain-containing protein 8 isoform X2 [Potentilla anserina]